MEWDWDVVALGLFNNTDTASSVAVGDNFVGSGAGVDRGLALYNTSGLPPSREPKRT